MASTNPRIAQLKDQRNERVGRVAALYLQQKPIKLIAELLQVNIRRVYNDIKLAREMWREAAKEELKSLLSKEIARIDLIEAEAWSAWTRSQQLAIEELRERSRSEDGFTKRRVTKKSKQVGDPRFLTAAMGCVAMRAKLLGLDKQDDGDADDVQIDAVEVIVKNREEAIAMMTFEDFRSRAK